jgi:hypothetical protein
MTCRNSDKRCSDSDAEAFAKSHSCNGSEPGFQALLTECRVSGAEFGAASVCKGCAPCKGGAFQWVRIPPGELLQPEATGAVREVTNWLKPSG